MTTPALLEYLAGQGVELTPDGVRLRYKAPPGVLTHDLLRELSRRKAEVIAALSANAQGVGGVRHDTTQIAPAPKPESQIGGRTVRQIYFEDAEGMCFQDADGRFWYFDTGGDELTELVPGKKDDAEEPIPPDVWKDVGTLLALIVLKIESPRQGFQVSPDARAPHDGLAARENRQDSAGLIEVSEDAGHAGHSESQERISNYFKDRIRKRNKGSQSKAGAALEEQGCEPLTTK